MTEMWVHIVIFVIILLLLLGWRMKWIPSSGIGGKEGIRLFTMVAVAGNLLGMMLTAGSGEQVYSRGYRLEKEDTGSYEKKFVVSVDGEKTGTLYVQIPEKEVQEQEEQEQTQKLTAKEQEQKDIMEEIARYNEEKGDPDYYYLPEQWNGKKLQWISPADTSGKMLTGIFLIAAMIVLVMKGREEQVQLQKRQEELLMDYPGLIMKFTLLVQAGMTVRKAFQKIALDYGRKKKSIKRAAYEEIRVVCYEMESGIMESESYERFGRRCERQEYIRLGALLSQNLRKGGKGLGQLLKTEAIQAQEERKAHAKRAGEEAGTKLLLPMFLMLAVVLVIVIIPAFLSVQL